MGALQQDLMGYVWRNADYVPGSKLPADTALDRAIAFFMGTDGLSIQKGTTHKQRRCARLDEENVSLSFMPLGRTVSFPVNQQSAVIGKISNLLHRKVVRIRGSIVMQLLVILFE